MSVSTIAHSECNGMEKVSTMTSATRSEMLLIRQKQNLRLATGGGRGGPSAPKATSFIRHLIPFIYLLIFVVVPHGAILYMLWVRLARPLMAAADVENETRCIGWLPTFSSLIKTDMFFVRFFGVHPVAFFEKDVCHTKPTTTRTAAGTHTQTSTGSQEDVKPKGYYTMRTKAHAQPWLWRHEAAGNLNDKLQDEVGGYPLPLR